MIERAGNEAGYRKTYRLTERGRRRLELEVQSLRWGTQLAQQRLGRR
jgi:DNA-binding PadR family transcriptional regulator